MRQLPALAQLKDEYGDYVEVLVLNVVPQYTSAEFVSWIKKHGSGDLPYATDGLNVALSLRVVSLGETVFIDGDGRVVARAQPPGLSYEELREVVQRVTRG